MRAVASTIPRLSRLWAPTGGIAVHNTNNAKARDGHEKLIRAGYLRQSHAGIFHLLPLGLRVQGKIEKLVEQHMEGALGASRVSLSSLSAEALWEKSGRLQNVSSEVSLRRAQGRFRFPPGRRTC